MKTQLETYIEKLHSFIDPAIYPNRPLEYRVRQMSDDLVRMREAKQETASHSELIAFASDIVGHDEETIQQMYNDWSRNRKQ